MLAPLVVVLSINVVVTGAMMTVLAGTDGSKTSFGSETVIGKVGQPFGGVGVEEGVDEGAGLGATLAVAVAVGAGVESDGSYSSALFEALLLLLSPAATSTLPEGSKAAV